MVSRGFLADETTAADLEKDVMKRLKCLERDRLGRGQVGFNLCQIGVAQLCPT